MVDALQMAMWRRWPEIGKIICHSEQGTQYTSWAFGHRLRDAGLLGSMGRVGSAYDNAMMESFWATLKTELIYQEHYATREQAKQSIFEYIEVFYNRKRLHSSLGYQSPEAFEAGLN